MIPSNSPQVFQVRQTKFSRVAYLAAILVVIAATVVLSAQQIAYGWNFDSWLLIGFWIGCCTISLIFQYRASTARLILSEAGVTYRGPYSTIRADWKSMSIGSNRILPDLFGPYRLFLATPPSQKYSLGKWLLAVLLGIGPLPIPLGPRLWEDYDQLIEELATRGLIPSRK
jgi:hypothetical protein